MTGFRYSRHGRHGRRGSAWQFYGPLMAMAASGGRRGDRDADWGAEWGGGPRGGRRRRQRMFGQGELRLALLALLAEQPRHGYELIKAIEEMTGGTYAPSPGAVYPTLQLLADEGRIAEAEADGPKKPFEATEEGRAELEERKSEVDALMERLDEQGSRAEKARSPDLMRALGNLATVLANKARGGRLDKAAMEEIVDIIDEVAKRIERL
ncbi:PadR family transcriptional regulator [Erythrobacter sp. HL-111]|uniref:PadR family transcriptional regulator n=1 Tax=Erythrobacter sp. HL-111 TaxID=1798193 RepID=UPI0006DBCD81|nr:PadR family transcriptional regulator [Erythrobacter sp. HL-111]KPP86657.1 MAG: putative transcriptional regulator [Erythrobacteraceae bacterium HL-111]SDR67725.1 DNA-binding transcriptional regulator, PadR family [Erythrobacter sp. HL-111]